MRIKNKDRIVEVDEVRIRDDDIMIGTQFIATGEHTEEIGKQLLEKGYADLTDFDCLRWRV